VCPGARYLPPKTELVVCCRLTQLQKELYLTLLDSKVRARVRIRVRVKVSYRRSFT
jgi:SNF2 family DNA or RNA helicase